MKRTGWLSIAGIVALSPLQAQTGTQATVVLGAGRAASWDTEIAVTNVDFNPLPVLVTTQLDRTPCLAAACNDYAETTIPSHGTFVLPSIPDPVHPALPPRPPFSNAPQAVYVISPANQKAPAVSAVAYDASSTRGRMTTLKVLPYAKAFNYGDIFFPGISRGDGRYANLM